MNYSIGDTVGAYENLHWQSDWTYEEVLGEEYAKNGNGVLGLYSDSEDEDVCYYIDYESGLVACVIKNNDEHLELCSEEWSEDFLCHLLFVQE